MQVDMAIHELKKLISIFEKYREFGFEEAMTEAKDIATTMRIQPVFRERRIIRRKKIV